MRRLLHQPIHHRRERLALVEACLARLLVGLQLGVCTAA